MRIHSAKTFLFQHPKKTEESVEIKNSEMKSLPDWVEDTMLFKLAMKDKDITIIESREQQISADNGDLNMEQKNKDKSLEEKTLEIKK